MLLSKKKIYKKICPEHPKRDQNLKFTPLSKMTSIPVCFIWESPPGLRGVCVLIKIHKYIASSTVLSLSHLKCLIVWHTPSRFLFLFVYKSLFRGQKLISWHTVLSGTQRIVSGQKSQNSYHWNSHSMSSFPLEIGENIQVVKISRLLQ